MLGLLFKSLPILMCKSAFELLDEIGERRERGKGRKKKEKRRGGGEVHN